MGKFQTTSTPPSSSFMRGPPCVKGHINPCPYPRYDSVWYKGVEGEEFMVYDGNQCYPEFVVKYERTGEEEKK